MVCSARNGLRSRTSVDRRRLGAEGADASYALDDPMFLQILEFHPMIARQPESPHIYLLHSEVLQPVEAKVRADLARFRQPLLPESRHL